VLKPIEENLLLTESKFINQKEYWVHKLSGEIGETRLLVEDQKNRHLPAAVDRVNIHFGEDLHNWLKRASKNSKLSLFIILLTGLKIMIHRYTGKEDITVVSPLFQATAEGIIFNDHVFIRDLLNSDMSFKEFLFQVRQSTLEAYDNQDYPSSELLEYLFSRRQIQKKSISRIVCALESIHDRYEGTIENVNDRIVFTFLEKEASIEGTIWYNPAGYDQYYIRQFSKQFVNLFESVMAETGLRISEINVLSKEEKEALVFGFNNMHPGKPECSPLPETALLHQLFEEQVERTPDHVALVYENRQFTYRQLNQSANRLARELRRRGVKAESIVGILLKPSIRIITGLLAILKAGGAYLPIDPDYPDDRIAFMLKDSSVNLLVTRGMPEKPNYFQGEVVDVAAVAVPGIDTKDEKNLEIVNAPADMAYIIYTSGTTGKPKGVVIEHRNVVAYIDAFNREFKLHDRDVVLQQFSYSFDAFVEEVYPILLKGGKLVMPLREVILDISLLTEFLVRHHITLMSCTPLLLGELNKVESLEPITGIHTFISGGDLLKGDHVDHLSKRAAVYNTYGPTETTVCVTYHRCRQGKSNLPLGKPIERYMVYILDGRRELLPVGVPGEICISGAGVGRGYLNRVRQTWEAFVPSPFIAGERMYKSGDLGRWRPDGNLEFLGRIDEQIKLRGYRIELGEIENRLLERDDIKEVVVTAREDKDGDKYLVAYLVPHHGSKQINEVDRSDLREYLLKHLPDYMVPSYFVPLPEIPITANGKVDRRSLPDAQLKAGANYVAPRNELENQLTGIWEDLLGVEKEVIGIDTNFFEIGGHSLKATILVSRIYKELHVKVPLSEVFGSSTIRGLARYITGAVKNECISLHAVEEKAYYEASSAQKRLFVLQKMDERSTAYNMPSLLKVEGHINKERLEEAFIKLIERHKSLKTSFGEIDGVCYQRIQPRVDFAIETYQCDPETSAFIRPFLLEQAPLLRVGMVEIKTGEYLLMMDMHHIISDGISQQVFVDDLMRLYADEALHPLKLQYKDYSQWHNSEKEQINIREQEAYWLKVFEGDIPVLDMPLDYPRPEVYTFEGDIFVSEIDQQLLGKLKTDASQFGVTLNIVLLTVYYILLAKYTGQDDIVVGVPTSGRTHPDLENIIGFFANMLAMRNWPREEITFREFLQEVKQNSIDAYENQEAQYEELIGKLNVQRESGRHPLVETVLVVVQSDELDPKKLKEIEKCGLRLSPYRFEISISHFDLMMHLTEGNHSMEMLIEYRTALFKKSTIEEFARHFIEILDQVLDNPNSFIGDIKTTHHFIAAEKNILKKNNLDFEF
jgi:amino acid adenylation domain-containing protein